MIIDQWFVILDLRILNHQSVQLSSSIVSATDFILGLTAEALRRKGWFLIGPSPSFFTIELKIIHVSLKAVFQKPHIKIYQKAQFFVGKFKVAYELSFMNR